MIAFLGELCQEAGRVHGVWQDTDEKRLEADVRNLEIWYFCLPGFKLITLNDTVQVYC